jgi:hypothetical protein
VLTRKPSEAQTQQQQQQQSTTATTAVASAPVASPTARSTASSPASQASQDAPAPAPAPALSAADAALLNVKQDVSAAVAEKVDFSIFIRQKKLSVAVRDLCARLSSAYGLDVDADAAAMCDA